MKIVAADPNVDGFMSFIGAAARRHAEQRPHVHAFEGPTGTQVERGRRSSRNCARNSRKLPGINVYLQNPPLIRIGGHATKALYQYSLQDTDVNELFHWAPILTDKLAQQPGFQDVTTDLQIASPQVNVEIDRDKAAALGVTPQQIENGLYDAFGERQSSTIYADVAEYWVVFEVLPQFQLDPAALAQALHRQFRAPAPTARPNSFP